MPQIYPSALEEDPLCYLWGAARVDERLSFVQDVRTLGEFVGSVV